MTDEDETKLLRIVGSGFFHTYPGRDANADALHSMCEALEARGKLRRHFDKPGHACWVAALTWSTE